MSLWGFADSVDFLLLRPDIEARGALCLGFLPEQVLCFRIQNTPFTQET